MKKKWIKLVHREKSPYAWEELFLFCFQGLVIVARGFPRIFDCLKNAFHRITNFSFVSFIFSFKLLY